MNVARWPSLPFEAIVLDASAGNNKVQKTDYRPNGAYPVVDQGQELIGGYSDDEADLVTGAGPWVVFGDHTRTVKFLDTAFCMGADGVKVLVPRDTKRLDARFLYWFLVAKPVPSAGYSRHYKFLKRLDVPLPPLSEQRRIAAILDKADALRRKRKRAIELLDSLAQSIFLEIFGNPLREGPRWKDLVPLAQLADIGSGITKGRKVNGSPTRSVPYLAVANVQDKALDLRAVKTIDATDSEIERYRLQVNDLLLTEGGDPDKLGRGTLWSGEIPETIHQNHVFRVRITSDRVLPLYLNWLVGSAYGKAYFLRSAKQTTGIASINKTQLSEFPVIMPPIDTQERFVARAKAVKAAGAQQSSMSHQVEALFSSLQHRAFSGQL